MGKKYSDPLVNNQRYGSGDPDPHQNVTDPRRLYGSQVPG